MNRDAHPRPDWQVRLGEEWLLLTFAVVTLTLALLDPQPLANYRQWLQLPTLAGLLGLLIAIQGIRDSALVQHAAAALAARMHSVRSLGLLLVTATALLSMVLTNDVSLFLIVPLTVAIGAISNLPLLRMVVLEALAVNAGSSLSPIGNPQNLLLWQHAHIPFFAFVAAMLPAATVMLLLVAALTWLWLPRDRIGLDHAKIDRGGVSMTMALLSTIALVAMVAMMEHGHAELGALMLSLPFALFARRSLAGIDWLLLATFAAIFLGLGHFAELSPVRHALAHLDLGRPLTVYASGIVASQLISNVPATVLLLERTPDAMALAVAVNVGGFGVAIGSLANLIALRLARQPGGLRQLHRVSIPFLLVCAPLVYLAWRWIGR
ncbi:MAG: citrate transporter [Xanthomonadaceae bacterium]|nr:citrate transporter [Xanthomonadaceae bacterium]